MPEPDPSVIDFVRGQTRGILATIRRDGRPQLSTVAYAFDGRTIRSSITETRAKTKNLRRDPRAVFYITTPDFAGYLAIDSIAEFSDVTTSPTDAAADELVEVYRAIAGSEHPNWDEYRAAMVEQQRLVLRLPIGHTYGWTGPNS
ncbi:MAG: putative F420-dependent enzyme [Pseudonocardiales bacterium]|nr:putative F420-dependent enzyme [Pseudonocardiales bacterium]